MSHNAFVEDKQILDASLIINEAIDSLQNENGGGILCKLEVDKAYDHINWNFLLWMLEMEFQAKRISWIHWYFSVVSFFIIINRTLTGFFQSSRGLKQGNPLSFLPFC